ncbi:hypothetical protein GM418_00115 [Maribellus comscasis]|uniref:Uncharacterized protein n=1 Tax=Maribellus comscasis TaxID=2681766 RepID=A0A6I6JQ23_9BACT|nr:hypothetical protein [Maribellus comscasis]QGY42113.1 hypothetical protein GM418_00115 [Maribellus comscasis]
MRNIIIFFLIFICWSTTAQEKLMPVMPLEKDSSQIELERQILYRQMLSGTLQSGGLVPDLEIPEFDVGALIAQQRYQFNMQDFLNPDELSTFSFNRPGFIFSPFLRNGAIFSGATYKLNDKIKLGGYSFGANSIFSAPLPNQNMNNFDMRGASMFFQYKVSDKFKIETRVSVTQGNGPGF